MSAPDDLPTHDLAAEKTVLGALLIDPKAIHQISSRLQSADFYDSIYGKIYTACLELQAAARPIDYLTLANHLANDKQIDAIGGTAFLAGLAESVPTASHIEHYATIVHDLATRRALVAAGQSITNFAHTEQSLTTAVESAQTTLLSLSQTSGTSKPEALASVAERRYDEIAQVQQNGDSTALRRVKTGFSNLDYYFNGFASGSLTVLAARPGMGKTALATNIAVNCAAKLQKQVVMFSLEMTKEELADRITAAGLGVSTWKMEKGDVTDEELGTLGQVIDGYQNCPLFIDDDPDTTLTNLRSKALAHKMEHGLDLLIVDYLQLIEIPRDMRAKENRVQEISLISRGLKRLAREIDAPVIALSQLNRAVENAPQAMPQLGHLRESGSIEQDSHNVLMLWREGYYNEDCDDPNVTTIFIRKNRQGPVGSAELVWNPQLMSFTPLDKSQSPAA